MVKVTRIIVGLEDIANVRATCQNPNCRGTVVFPLDSMAPMPTSCPCCGCQWRDNIIKQGDISESDFISRLKLMIDRPNPRVTIQFEIEGD